MFKTRGHSVEINRETCEFYAVNNAELNQTNNIYSVSLAALHFGLVRASSTTRRVCMPDTEHMVL